MVETRVDLKCFIKRLRDLVKASYWEVHITVIILKKNGNFNARMKIREKSTFLWKI